MKKQVYIDLLPIIESRGISQRELLRMIETKTGERFRQPAINEWCRNDTKRLPLDLLASICEVLDVGICDILKLVDVE